MRVSIVLREFLDLGCALLGYFDLLFLLLGPRIVQLRILVLQLLLDDTVEPLVANGYGRLVVVSLGWHGDGVLVGGADVARPHLVRRLHFIYLLYIDLRTTAILRSSHQRLLTLLVQFCWLEGHLVVSIEFVLRAIKRDGPSMRELILEREYFDFGILSVASLDCILD